jgi:flagellar hook-length control protein FliK
MPLLAASLREAGLTLSGGGVFDQPRQAQPGHAQAAGSRRGNDATERDDGAPPIAALPTLRRRGVVDLIA